jgi:CDGSH-type Zn-finger protein
MMSEENKTVIEKRIVIVKDGPYLIKGDIPLTRKTQIVSEYGEPLTWKKEETLETAKAGYALCRCGQSGHKPFCDGTHRKIDFDGTETADVRNSSERQKIYRNSTNIVVKMDTSLCMDSGFCGMQKMPFVKFVAATDDTKMRSLVIAMIERCPSGALTYHIEEGEPDIEPDLPQQVVDSTEITSDGPIAGPLWVTGGIPIERSDGQPFEVRNRVTLCNCGASKNKPLCDGTHRRRKDELKRHRES